MERWQNEMERWQNEMECLIPQYGKCLNLTELSEHDFRI
jgi:hypothetical protein